MTVSAELLLCRGHLSSVRHPYVRLLTQVFVETTAWIDAKFYRSHVSAISSETFFFKSFNFQMFKNFFHFHGI